MGGRASPKSSVSYAFRDGQGSTDRAEEATSRGRGTGALGWQVGPRRGTQEVEKQ